MTPSLAGAGIVIGPCLIDGDVHLYPQPPDLPVQPGDCPGCAVPGASDENCCGVLSRRIEPVYLS
ncbi:hypothetical protein CDEF62S_00349 [Castellaniella defragrans]